MGIKPGNEVESRWSFLSFARRHAAMQYCTVVMVGRRWRRAAVSASSAAESVSASSALTPTLASTGTVVATTNS